MYQDNPPPYSVATATAPGVDAKPNIDQPPLGMHPSYGFTAHPPQPNHPFVQQPHQPSTQTTQVIIVQQPSYGPLPVNTICPSCHAQICTSVVAEPNTMTHMTAVLMCIFGLFLCACLPYCIDSCQSRNHYCPKCQAFLGTYQNTRRY